MAGFGDFLGGAGSGAIAGSAFGPWGAAAGTVLGGLGGIFGGGETPTYEPTPLQEDFVEYAQNQITPTTATKKRIRSKANMLARTAGVGAAEEFLERYVDTFNDPFIDKQLKKSYKKDVDYNAPAYWNIADQLYKEQGIGFTGSEYTDFANAARSSGIRSPQAFGDMIKRRLMVEGKVATPQQEMLGMMFGGIRRDPTGKILNTYPTLVRGIDSLLAKSPTPTTNTINV